GLPRRAAELGRNGPGVVADADAARVAVRDRRVDRRGGGRDSPHRLEGAALGEDPAPAVGPQRKAGDQGRPFPSRGMALLSARREPHPMSREREVSKELEPPPGSAAAASSLTSYRLNINLPNGLTLFRIFLVPFLVVVLLTKFDGREIVALAIFLIATATDFLDGWLARRRGEITTFGTLLDPIADKLLVSAAFISLVEIGLAPPCMVLLAT